MLTKVFYTVLNLSLIGTVMIPGVVLIRGLALKKRLVSSPSLVLLWLVIMLRMMTPFSVVSPLGTRLSAPLGLGWLSAEHLQALSQQTNEGHRQDQYTETDLPGYYQDPSNIQHKTTNPNETPVPPGGETGGAREMGANTTQSEYGKSGNDSGEFLADRYFPAAYNALPTIWLFGASMLACTFLCTSLFTKSKEKDTAEISSERLQEAKALAGIGKKVSLKIRKSGSSKQDLAPASLAPYVSGIFFPSIILPAETSEDNRHLYHILLHELIHIKHWDNLKKTIAAAALCLHWFNPIFWLCWTLFQRDLECSCDEKVVRLLGDQNKTKYAESLYEFACKSQNALLCHFSSARKTAVHRRVKRILTGSSRLNLAGMVSLAMAFLLVVAGCTVDPTAKTPEVLSPGFVVYAAQDGLYKGTFSGASEKLFNGEKVSHPVLSENGDMVMFRQNNEEDQGKINQADISLYVCHLGLKQTMLLEESSSSYCMGPNNSFIVATTDGKLLEMTFQVSQDNSMDGLERETKNIAVWPESVTQSPKMLATYENLHCSPDGRYLAYSTSILDNRSPSESGFQIQPAYYNGGLYVLDLDEGKASTIVPSRPSTVTSLGANPVPGPWSPDSKILTIWNKPQSGSLSADGVGVFFYHIDTGLKTEFALSEPDYTEWEADSLILAYDENVSFSNNSSVAMLSGGGREMFFSKEICLVEDLTKSKAQFHAVKDISEGSLVPSMPQLSADESILYFAAIDAEGGRKSEAPYPLKRQLYRVELGKGGEIEQLTFDAGYRNESPLLLKDEKHLIFGRASAEAYDGKMEIWILDLLSGEETKLAEWTEPEPTNVWMSYKYNDYYGRGDWSNIFVVYHGQ